MDHLAALCARLGDRLTVVRDGRKARWSYDGLTAIVEVDGEFANAVFADRPVIDVWTKQTCTAVYRPVGNSYDLSPSGSERLARDVADFFTGVREPRFAFSAVFD